MFRKNRVNFMGMLVLVALILEACTRTQDPQPTAQPDWFPTDSGLVREYYVFDTTFVTGTGDLAVDTLTEIYRLQEVYTGLVSDTTGTTYRLLERRRSAAGDTAAENGYLPGPQLWRERLDGPFADRIAETERTLPLQFPAAVGDSWNALRYSQNETNNADGYQPYRYSSIDTTLQTSGGTWSGCAWVTQRNPPASLVDTIYTVEAFAPGVGRVYFYDRFLKLNITGTETELSTASYLRRLELVAFQRP